MKSRLHTLLLSIALLLPALAPATPPSPTMPPAMTQTAQGRFDVQLIPMDAPPGGEAEAIGRMLIRKQFYGDLDATSLGEMLAHRSGVAGSAGYVAMERVHGRLAGRSGSFVLMHAGEMDRGQAQLTVRVVPDSATGELTGLAGTLAIDIRDGQHFYTFDYRLPAR